MSKNKVSYEKKVEIVRDYLDGRVGYKESIQRANNSAASFRHWVHLYTQICVATGNIDFICAGEII